MSTRHFTQQPATIGTSRRNPFTNDRVRGEFNQFGETMPPDPMHAPFVSNLDKGVFAPPVARSPMAPTPRPTGVGPALRSGGLKTGTLSLSSMPSPFPMPFGLPSATMMAKPTPPVPAPAPSTAGSFPAIGETKSTATGMQSFQPATGGGRWVGTTSPSLVPRPTNSGTVTNPGATPFDERGMQQADLGGPDRARVYDPRQDMSKTFLDASGNATTPRVGTFPGGPALPAGIPRETAAPGFSASPTALPSVRGVMIDPKYQTPGASPVGVISGGTVSDGSGASYNPQSGQVFPKAPPPQSSPVTANGGSLHDRMAAGVAGSMGTLPATSPTPAKRPGFGDLRVAESKDAIRAVNPGAFPSIPRGFGDLHVADSAPLSPAIPSSPAPASHGFRGASIRMARESGSAASPNASDDETKRRQLLGMGRTGY